MRMWRRYDKTRSGAIENRWIRQFLADLILSRGGKIVEEALDTYTDGIVRLSRACARAGFKTKFHQRKKNHLHI